MGAFLLYLSLALVVLWTARLARSRMRNPWLWGGAALILLLVPWKLLGMVPLVLLMVLKTPKQQRQGTATQTAACPRCRAPQPHTLKYCTKCGWELAIPHPESPASDQGSPASTANAGNSQPLNPSVSPTLAQASQPVPAVDRPHARTDSPTPGEAAPPEAATAAQSTAPQTTAPGAIPTATSMTERGVRLFNQGRVQESIDQFTKAIALDPNYVEAWAHRAEAYARLGRGAEAAEDRRRIEALDAGSTGG